MPARGARVDPEARHEQVGIEVEVRRRVAELSAARVACDHDAVELRRAPEHGGSLGDLSPAQQRPDRRGRDAVRQRDGANVEPESLEQPQVSTARPSEAEPFAGHDDARPDRAQEGLGEVARLEAGQLGRELDDERLLDTGVREQLEPALERRQKLDLVAADDTARMRVERDDGRDELLLARGRARGVEHGPVPTVNAVERPDRDRARPPLQRVEAALDSHAAPASRASASSTGTIRSGSASSTENGPTSVLRSVRQWPPSASAIERTYVPELTSRSSVAMPSVCAMTSSACTSERRTGMSTFTPLRCRRYARSPPIFTAEAAGIGSSTSPRRAATRRSSSAGSGGSWRSRTSPSGSPVEVVDVRSTSVR